VDRPIRVGARRLAALATIALLVAACGSSSTPAPASSAAASPATPASQAPASVASSPAPASSPSGGTLPSAAASSAATPAASVSVSGAVPQPSGTPCEWLDKTSIDATLGLNVGSAIPSGGTICTWVSKTPAGGIELAIVTVQEVGTIVDHYSALPGGQLVPGLGVKAASVSTTGMAAPLPKNHYNLMVDFGGWGLSVDISGPAVTLAEAEALAAAVVSH
jgi:hypothetical protein